MGKQEQIDDLKQQVAELEERVARLEGAARAFAVVYAISRIEDPEMSVPDETMK